METKTFEEWQRHLAESTSVDALSDLITREPPEIEETFHRITIVMTHIVFEISRIVARLENGDRGMFEAMEPLFSQRNRMSYVVRGEFLKQQLPDFATAIEDATQAALTFTGQIDCRTAKGQMYLELQREAYGRALAGIDREIYRRCAGAAAVFEATQLIQERIATLASILPSVELNTLLTRDICLRDVR